MRGALRRLAVVLGGGRRAGRPGAGAVQGVLRRRRRFARRRGGHDVPVHLGRPRLRARARVDPGLPEEARADRDDAVVRPGLPGGGADVRRRVLGARASARAGDGHARARVGGGADAQRSAAREPPPLPAAGVGSPRRPGRPRAGAGEEQRPLDLADPRGPGDARAPRRAGRGARRPRARSGSARASASRSRTRSTTSRRCGRSRGGTRTVPANAFRDTRRFRDAVSEMQAVPECLPGTGVA